MSSDGGTGPEIDLAQPQRDSRVETLFDPGVVAFVLRGRGDYERLLPAERDCAATFGMKRKAEFAAGRACAHAALRTLGLPSEGLVVESDRRPSWPSGVVGSISHTEGSCGAVVARTERFAALGLDVERTGRVAVDLWPHLFVDSELDLLRGVPPETADLMTTVVFSAKESLYKCRFGLTGGWLDFTDVAITFEAPVRWRTGAFVARLVVPDAFTKLNAIPGRYITDTDVVWSAVTVKKKDL